MDITRDKLRVFEAMYNVISESSEWAYNSGNDYMYFIEGVVAMVREQIKEIDERPIGEPEPESSVGGYVATQDSFYATHGKIEE